MSLVDTSTNRPDLRKRLRHLNLIVTLGFFAAGVVLVYWSAIRAQSILNRDDNPRIVDQEIETQRGTIFSTNNVVLAETAAQEGETRRIYRSGGGPIVGYYSIRHGTTGIEETFDPILRGSSGDFWTDYWRYNILHEPRIGEDIRLTLDERWQRAGDQLMGDRKGAALLISLPDNSIRALVSKPDYDPNQLDEDFDSLINDSDAPLLNRVTQGRYQPGLTLMPFIIAGAYESGLIDLEDDVPAINQEVKINGESIRCQSETVEEDGWEAVLEGACPGPLQQLGLEFGDSELTSVLKSFGFNNEGGGDLEGSSADFFENLGLAAVGYDRLAVSPLEVGLALSALANEGLYIESKLADAVQGPSNHWESVGETRNVSTAVSADSAEAVRGLLPVNRGISEFNTTVLSGPESTTNSWYIAMAPADNPLYAIVVVVEGSADPESSSQVGRSLLRNVLSPGGDP